MKKVFSVALAASMIAGLAATSLAATYGDYATTLGSTKGYVSGYFNKSDPTYKVDGSNVYGPVVGVYGPLTYNNDDKMLNISGKAIESGSYTGTNAIKDIVEYGDTAYYALLTFVPNSGVAQNGAAIAGTDQGSFSIFSEAEIVSSLKIKTKWEQGSDIVNSVSVVKKKVSNSLTTPQVGTENKVYADATAMNLDKIGYTTPGGYYYFLAIDVKDSSSTSDTDVIGTVTLTKSSNPKVTDYMFDVNLTVNWKESYLSVDEYTVTGDISDLKANTTYSFKFDSDEEIELGFGTDSYFRVDVSGQGKLLLSYDNTFNSKIAAKYPLAELNFWNGNGATFNRTGQMFIKANNSYEKFIYQLNSDGSLSEVTGATYDKSDEGFYFYTRTLGSYVLSDTELDLSSSVTTPEVTTPEVTTPPVTTPQVTNPSTGAAA